MRYGDVRGGWLWRRLRIGAWYQCGVDVSACVFGLYLEVRFGPLVSPETDRYLLFAVFSPRESSELLR